MNFRTFAAASIIAAGVGSTAHAATVTHLIHFDELDNNSNIAYTDPTGYFSLEGPNGEPVNFSSGNCAPSTNGGNGSCVHELGNGQSAILTHDADLDGNFAEEEVFDFLGFYFYLNGNKNFFEVTANTGFSLKFSDDDDEDDSLLQYLTRLDGDPIDDKTDIKHNTQYYVDLSSVAEFQGVFSVTFSKPSDNQTRLDCLVVRFEGDIEQQALPPCGLGDGGGLEVVPLPASLPLLLGGLGIAGFVARRRKRTS